MTYRCYKIPRSWQWDTNPDPAVQALIFPQHHHLTNSQLVVTYKECLKNHAASLGGLDGSGKFMLWTKFSQEQKEKMYLFAERVGCAKYTAYISNDKHLNEDNKESFIVEANNN